MRLNRNPISMFISLSIEPIRSMNVRSKCPLLMRKKFELFPPQQKACPCRRRFFLVINKTLSRSAMVVFRKRRVPIILLPWSSFFPLFLLLDPCVTSPISRQVRNIQFSPSVDPSTRPFRSSMFGSCPLKRWDVSSVSKPHAV